MYLYSLTVTQFAYEFLQVAEVCTYIPAAFQITKDIWMQIGRWRFNAFKKKEVSK